MSPNLALTKPTESESCGITGISLQEMIFVGDALFVGGNDYPAKEAGVVSVPVRGPSATKPVTEAIIACLDGDHQA
jgi:hypothetical protein